MNDEFRKELTALLNRHSIDNNLNTPDFILAENILQHLESLKKLKEAREQWFNEKEEHRFDWIHEKKP